MGGKGDDSAVGKSAELGGGALPPPHRRVQLRTYVRSFVRVAPPWAVPSSANLRQRGGLTPSRGLMKLMHCADVARVAVTAANTAANTGGQQ